ncbi:MAG: hypothetical protein K2Q25_10350 [Mycobacteriaceae bacterium]|nr:hypothetical protein [Mycobacteriaceae bacterium]
MTAPNPIDEIEHIELPDIRHHGTAGNPARVHPYAPVHDAFDDGMPRNWDAMSGEERRALFQARMQALRDDELGRALRRDQMVERIMDPLVHANIEHLVFEEAAERAAARQAQLRECCARHSAAVVATLMALAGLITLIVSETGSGQPDPGNGFQDRSAQLRDDAAERLQSARPTYWCWSGATATHYEDRTGEQQARVTAVAAADLQTAAAVANQADQVEQSRRTLEATMVALVGGIAVVKVLDAGWQAAIAAGSPAAPALGMLLLTLGACFALAAITATIAVLIEMDKVAKLTKAALHAVTTTYQSVVDDVAARAVRCASASRRMPTTATG